MKGQEVTAVEAARLLKVGLYYLYQLIWTGKLRARKIGRRWYVTMDSVETRLKGRK